MLSLVSSNSLLYCGIDLLYVVSAIKGNTWIQSHSLFSPSHAHHRRTFSMLSSSTAIQPMISHGYISNCLRI